jgi:hypothetical protein
MTQKRLLSNSCNNPEGFLCTYQPPIPAIAGGDGGLDVPSSFIGE